MKIASSVFEDGFYISNSKYIIDELDIVCGKQLSGNIDFSNISVKKLKLKGNNANASLIFQNVKFDKIEIDTFFNQSNLQFVKALSMTEESEMSIRNSNLGKCQFLTTNLDHFKTITISDSILIELILAGSDWFNPDKLQTSILSNTENTEDTVIEAENIGWIEKLKNWFKNEKLDSDSIFIQDLKRKREIFRQLKLASEKQSDFINALNFKHLELSFLDLELKNTKSRFHKERLMMWLNRSNEHGRNWSRPIFLIFALIAIFYPILIYVLHLSNPRTEYKFELWNMLNLMPQMLNPTRNFTRLFDIYGNEIKSINGWFHLFDIFHRTILSFLIVQTVAAFRKYTK